SACITLENEIKPEGEIGVMKVPGGRYAVGRFEIKPEGFTASWDSMCHWLAQSGYQPADSWPYELYHNDHTKHPEGKFILDICIPVKAL
ncbi:MAG: AraC family transcriptional regulator, partial [Bacteroidota bacterium]